MVDIRVFKYNLIGVLWTKNNKLTNKEIVKIINDIDYFTKEDYISDKLKDIITDNSKST